MALIASFIVLLAIIATLSAFHVNNVDRYASKSHRALSDLKASCDGHSKGFNLMKNPWKNKGRSFTPAEVEANHLEGLVPCGAPLSLESKVELSIDQLRKKSSPLEKYNYLHTIQDSDETLFYAILGKYTKETMPLVYTPTVGTACLEWSHISRQQPRGIYLGTQHLGKVKQALQNYPNKDIKVIVFTDGERILGLGDLGANGMGIPVGKLALYTTCAGIRPEQCLPITLDVGTNTDSILQDPYYIGIKQKRDRSEKYDQLVEELFTAAQELYGRDVLLQFEDFGNSNAFRLLERYRNRATCFNDDIQGTASVVVAGLYAALPLTPHKKLAEHRYLFFGAGEAGIGIADLLVSAIAKEKGHTGDLAEIRKNCWFVDSKGLITNARLTDGSKFEHHKVPYAHVVEPGAHVGKTLIDAVKYVKPTAIIGVSAQGQTFTEEVVKQLHTYTKNPIIFALSNPTNKAECTAEQAYTWTNGQAVFASGSPFDSVTLADGRAFHPGQGNNAYIFPGVGLGALVGKALSVTDDDFLVAAETLAGLVTPDRLKIGAVYPDLSEIRSVSKLIAAKVAENVFKTGRSSISAKDGAHIDWLKACDAAMYKPQY